jgi:hypothetical protein
MISKSGNLKAERIFVRKTSEYEIVIPLLEKTDAYQFILAC